jgi:hypothetical protein
MNHGNLSQQVDWQTGMILESTQRTALFNLFLMYLAVTQRATGKSPAAALALLELALSLLR